MLSRPISSIRTGGRTQHDRHEESFSTEDSGYDKERDEDQLRRDEAAERLKNDPLPSPAE